jgi:hypothetical protein
MSRDRDGIAAGKTGEHASTGDTARINYERLRSVGVDHATAKSEAGKIADQTHRHRDTKR